MSVTWMMVVMAKGISLRRCHSEGTRPNLHLLACFSDLPFLAFRPVSIKEQ